MTDWLTTEEAAGYLKVHPKTLYRYVRAGKLRQYNPGGRGHPRFLVEELDAFLGDASAAAPAHGRPLEGEPPEHEDTDEASRNLGDESTGAVGGSRRRGRGFAFGSGFALVQPPPAPERINVLREVLRQIEDLNRRCEELRHVVAKLLEQEERENP